MKPLLHFGASNPSMAVLQVWSLHGPHVPSQLCSFTARKLAVSRQLPPFTRRDSVPVLASSARESLPATEQDILDAIGASDGPDRKCLPCVRTYENDLARLTLVGAVDFEQALTAAAADGGEAAAEHISSAIPAMVVETVFPGPADEHSTVSTRLFLPARKVKEKAKKLKSTLTEDFLSNTTSKNILAMTFRQVVVQQLWNFELVLFTPGAERNMADLENPREVSVSFSLSSADEQPISKLAEVVCISALESTEKHFFANSMGKTSNKLLNWFCKPKRMVSTDSSVILHKLFEDEIVTDAKNLLENFSSRKATNKPAETRLKYSWWTLSACCELEKIGGPEFSKWISEYIPAYRLQIDGDKLKNVKFGGWMKTSENTCEVLLTHYQMVGLANILDMYYEDLFTLPDKQLPCGVAAKSTKLSLNKRSSSLLKMLSITLASGFFLFMIGVLGLRLPHPHNGRKFSQDNHLRQSSERDRVQHQSLESSKSVWPLDDKEGQRMQKTKKGK